VFLPLSSCIVVVTLVCFALRAGAVCSGVTADDALDMIAGGGASMRRLIDRHDELTLQRESDHIFFNFVEPPMGDDHYPTYKKNEAHGPPNRRDPSWASSVYHTSFREPMYKGGRVRPRIPGWCDRILYHSMADLRHLLVCASDVTDAAGEHARVSVTSGDVDSW
jgi:hypothetical protein